MIDLFGDEIEEAPGFIEPKAPRRGYKMGDWLKAIQKTKENLFDEENLYEKELIRKSYLPYIINHCLMAHPDTVLLANEMNKMGDCLDQESQFLFLINTIEPKFRKFKSWLKADKDEEVNSLMLYYGYSKQKAREVYPLLSVDQLKFIKTEIEKRNDRYNGGS